MVKIIFRLEQNAYGFPPIRAELLNASPLAGGVFRIENTPYFTANISYHDVVRASPTDLPGQFQFEEVVEPSSFTALSIIIMDESVDARLMELFRGCIIEYGEFGAWRVMAIAVPLEVNYHSLREQLQALENRDLISFAELAIPLGDSL